MKFPDVLYAYLSAHDGLVSLVGEEIYPNVFPQDTPPPYVALQRSGQDKLYSHGGYSGSSVYHYRLLVFAATKEEVELVSQQIALAMNAWRSVNPAIGYAIEKDCTDAYEVGPDLYRIDLKYKVFYNE